MIDSREQLIHVLTEAAEVEHNLLCSYLYAVFSLKRAGEPGLSEAQGEAVERWRKMILSVALQEMAHLACVNNLLLAVGGAPHFDRPNLPVAAGYHPAGITVRLTPFDAATLDHFIFLERPDTKPLADAPGFEPAASGPRQTRDRPLTPSAIDYDTIGALYDALAAGFEHLVARHGEAALIDPTGRGQLGPEEGKLDDIVRVTNLAEALEVIAEIKEQGEGASGDREDSHFQRFTAIRDEWEQMLAADPGFAPAWPAAHDPVMRRPADDAERVWITDPKAADWLDLGNAAYGAMLSVLTQLFSIDDRSEQAALMVAAVQLMEVAAALGSALTRMPARPDRPGVHAGLTFTVPRNLGYRPGLTRTLVLARVEELRAAAEDLLDGETLEKARRRFGACAEALA